MGICNLKHINSEIGKRREAVNTYQYYLEGARGIKINVQQTNVVPNYAYFPVEFDAKKYDMTLTPIALKVSQRVLTLPLYADLDKQDIERICNIILNCR